MINQRLKNFLLGAVIISIVATNFAWIKPAQAVLGVADVTVVTVVVDTPRTIFQIGAKIVGIFFQQLRRRFITMLQNDLVNWVQGGGRPRFVTNPKKFLKQTADQAAVSAL
ncbi:MAG: hypothetical protein AAB722_00610, partial [Patescibacteria group bacterium]